MNDPLEEEDKENTAPAQESVTRGKATPPPLSFQEYQYTPYEELLLTRAAHLTERSFPVGTVYESEKILKDSFYQWGLEQGVLICVKHRHFVCSKHGLMPSELKRTQVRQASSQHAKTRTKKTTRCGCKFKIRYVPAGPEHPPGAVRITSGSYYAHTNGCVPSRDQLLGDMHKLGKLTDLRKLTQTASNLFHVRAIAVIVKANGTSATTTAAIRPHAIPLFPDRFDVNSQVCWNLKKRLENLMVMDPSTAASDDIELYKRIFTDIDVYTGLSCETNSILQAPPTFVDIATRSASEVWGDVCRHLKSYDGRFDGSRVHAYLSTLADLDPSFKYKSFRRGGNYVGFVWQNQSMRESWDLFGDVINVDFSYFEVMTTSSKWEDWHRKLGDLESYDLWTSARWQQGQCLDRVEHVRSVVQARITEAQGLVQLSRIETILLFGSTVSMTGCSSCATLGPSRSVASILQVIEKLRQPGQRTWKLCRCLKAR